MTSAVSITPCSFAPKASVASSGVLWCFVINNFFLGIKTLILESRLESISFFELDQFNR